MSVSKMEKLTVILPQGEVDALMRALMKLRTVSLTAEESELLPDRMSAAAAAREAAARAARVDAILPILTKRSRRKKPLLAAALPFDPALFKGSGEEEKAWKTVTEAERIQESIAALKERLAAEEALMQSLLPYLDFSFALNDPGTRTARLLLGSLPTGIRRERVEELSAELGFVAEVLSEDSHGTYLAILFHRTDEERVTRALGAIGFLRASFAESNGKAVTVFDAAQKRANGIKRDLARLEGQLDVLADNLTALEVLSDLEHTTRLAEENKASLLLTGKCAVLTGWCPVREKARVTKVLERFSAAYDFTPPGEGEDVPVLLHNNPYSRNFEWVLGMYSYPKYGKFDPTLLMSLFYFIIFGLMFADAGYGLMLTVLCFGAVKWLEPRESMKRFLLMFGYCGISSIIFGVLFGSYFGNFPLAFMENMLNMAPEEMPNLALLPSLEANVAILFDPIQNPMAFMVISLAVGAVHILAGMAVKAFILCREGKPLDALFDIGSYWALFAGIGVIFLHRTWGTVLIAVGVAAILATQGRAKKGVLGKIVGGLGGLYALINYASDLLSYSRILALGLAAGVIGQVVNVLATMKGASFIGFLLMIVVFLIGHVLNLVINVLGTFVHTSRLQYIEFFGRFYEDGGTPFTPMTNAEKYTVDVSEEISEEPTAQAEANAPPPQDTATVTAAT